MTSFLHRALGLAATLLGLLVVVEMSYSLEQGNVGWPLAGKVATAAALIFLLRLAARRHGPAGVTHGGPSRD